MMLGFRIALTLAMRGKGPALTTMTVLKQHNPAHLTAIIKQPNSYCIYHTAQTVSVAISKPVFKLKQPARILHKTNYLLTGLDSSRLNMNL